ncbi:MAG TPA: hypothetical protein VES20_13385 [Bryobacteraceae bacterium]|nr:hypothetical protein [Bryobacteraceae bacterium]
MDANRRACIVAILLAGLAHGQQSAAEHFARGLRWLHSFEYDDAREEFIKSREADPAFVMAYWGEALSHTEFLWQSQDLTAGRAALARLGSTPTERLRRARTERERSYLKAVEALYGAAEYASRTYAFAEAMRQLSTAYPDDLDASALYALSILGTAHRGRDYATYMRAAAVAEDVYARDPNHPGALHYLIHCYDDPVHAPLGLRAARRYASVAPDAAHALHMPSHIFVALGMWDDVVASNEASWNASVRRADTKKLGIEERSYHAFYWLEYALLQQGRYREAASLLALMQKDAEGSDSAYLRYHLALMASAYVAETGDGTRLPVALRIDDIDAHAAAAFLFARGYQAWRNGDGATARRMIQAIRSTRKQASSQHEHASLDTEAALEIMALQLEGLISRNVAALRRAASLEASMPFEFGPPMPPKPAAELLGEVLLREGRFEEARNEFGKALSRSPGRPLALRGLALATAKVGHSQQADAINAELRHIRRKADVPWKE